VTRARHTSLRTRRRDREADRRRRECPHTRHRQNERASSGSALSEAPHWRQYVQRTKGPTIHEAINANQDGDTGGTSSIADPGPPRQYSLGGIHPAARNSQARNRRDQCIADL
jgi:hypothetical protein